MMRRMCVGAKPLSRGAAAALTTAARFGGHAPTVHDQSGLFARALTVDEQLALEDQKHRTVSGVVPGKMFLRHWTAAEQSTVSILNRVLSIIVTLGIVLWAGAYSSLGFNGMNAVHAAALMFLWGWLGLHTHVMVVVIVPAIALFSAFVLY